MSTRCRTERPTKSFLQSLYVCKAWVFTQKVLNNVRSLQWKYINNTADMMNSIQCVEFALTFVALLISIRNILLPGIGLMLLLCSPLDVQTLKPNRCQCSSLLAWLSSGFNRKAKWPASSRPVPLWPPSPYFQSTWRKHWWLEVQEAPHWSVRKQNPGPSSWGR